MSLSEQNRALIQRDLGQSYWEPNDGYVWLAAATEGDLNRLLDAARAEGVAALQQAGWRPMADAHKNGEPILALTISQFPGRPDLDHWRNKQIVVHHRGLAPDGFDIGWSMNAPVGHGGFPDDWFVGWAPIPQQTALVEPYSSELDEINGRLA